MRRIRCEVYLWFFDFHSVGDYEFPLPEKGKFKVTLIDPYAMTRTEVPGTFSGKSHITLTGKPYMAALVEKGVRTTASSVSRQLRANS